MAEFPAVLAFLDAADLGAEALAALASKHGRRVIACVPHTPGIESERRSVGLLAVHPVDAGSPVRTGLFIAESLRVAQRFESSGGECEFIIVGTGEPGFDELLATAAAPEARRAAPHDPLTPTAHQSSHRDRWSRPALNQPGPDA